MRLDVGQICGVAGAMARRTYTKHGRGNPPLDFVEVDGRWRYRMSTEVAELWLRART